MSARDDVDSAEAEHSAWSHEVEVPPRSPLPWEHTTTQRDWTSVTAAAARPSTQWADADRRGSESSGSPATVGVSVERSTGSSAGIEPAAPLTPQARDRRRATRAIIGWAVVLVVGLATVAVVNRDDGTGLDDASVAERDAATGSASTDDEPTVPAAADQPTSDEAPVVSAPPFDNALDAPSLELVELDPDGADRGRADGDVGESSGNASEDDVAQWERVNWLSPTFGLFGESSFDLVLTSSGGDLYELSVPDGRWRRVDLGPGFGSDEVVVGDTIVGVRRNDGGMVAVTDVGALQLGVGDWQMRPGTDEFFGFEWPENFDGPVRPEFKRFVVEVADGRAVRAELPVDPNTEWSQFWSPAGWQLVTDAGGTYELTDDGARRLSSGFVADVTPTHMLFYECDERRQCGYVVQDAAGERVVLDMKSALGLADAPSGQIPTHRSSEVILSPDGRSLLVQAWGRFGSIDPSTEPSVDLFTFDESGQFTDWVRSSTAIGQFTYAWLPDSSGVLALEPRSPNLSIVRRTGGKVTNFELRFDAVGVAVRSNSTE